jgi:F-type H+-transporting ATPase subunit alpha
VEILKQGQFSPLTVEKQIAIIYCGTNGLLKDVPVNKVKEFEAEFLGFLETKHKDVLETLKAGKFTDEAAATLQKVSKDLAIKYKQ